MALPNGHAASTKALRYLTFFTRVIFCQGSIAVKWKHEKQVLDELEYHTNIEIAQSLLFIKQKTNQHPLDIKQKPGIIQKKLTGMHTYQIHLQAMYIGK